MLRRTFGCVRLVWNKTLAVRQERYTTEKRSTPYKETDAALAAWKQTEELSFLGEVSSVPLQQVLRHQHTAFQSFFNKVGRYPRFKNRNGRQSAHYTRSAFRIKTDVDGKLKIRFEVSNPVKYALYVHRSGTPRSHTVVNKYIVPIMQRAMQELIEDLSGDSGVLSQALEGIILRPLTRGA